MNQNGRRFARTNKRRVGTGAFLLALLGLGTYAVGQGAGVSESPTDPSMDQSYEGAFEGSSIDDSGELSTAPTPFEQSYDGAFEGGTIDDSTTSGATSEFGSEFDSEFGESAPVEDAFDDPSDPLSDTDTTDGAIVVPESPYEDSLSGATQEPLDETVPGEENMIDPNRAPAATATPDGDGFGTD